jgi:hypothetical protein
MSHGIEVRHARTCRAHAGGRFIVVVEPIALLELVKSLVLLCPSLLRHVVHMED